MENNIENQDKEKQLSSPQIYSQKQINYKNGKNNYLLIGFFLIVIVGGFGYFYIMNNNKLSSVSNQKQFTNQITNGPVEDKNIEITKQPSPKIEKGSQQPNVKLESGFTFNIPSDWSVKISDQSKQHFFGKIFIPGVNIDNSYIEIESISSSQMIKNPLIKEGGNEQKLINGLNATIIEGKENFRNSNRIVKQAIFNNKGNSLILTLYTFPNDSDNTVRKFNSFIESVEYNKPVTKNFNFIKKSYAEESIAGFNIDKYTNIEVMGDPLPERITQKDAFYKDGFAKFYKFNAFKGQRLVAHAFEDRTTNSNSFIRGELYDEQGQQLYSRDTRIEFEAPYTGVYYWIVKTFNNQEGGYLLKVFDRDQTDNLLYVKYNDGSEKFADPGKSVQHGENEVALILIFNNPVEVIDNKTVRFYSEPKEFEPALGLITTPVLAYMKEMSYQDFIRKITPYTEEVMKTQNIEADPKYLVNTKFTKLSQSKILIEHEQLGTFPKNHQIVITEKRYGIYRVFTENP